MLYQSLPWPPKLWQLALLSDVDPRELCRLLRTGEDNTWTLLISAGLSRPACILPGEEVAGVSLPCALNAICTSGDAKFSNDDLRDVIYYLLTQLVKQIYDTFTYSADAFSRKVPVFPKSFVI